MDNDIFQGYKGRALDVLKKFNVRVWGQADVTGVYLFEHQFYIV